MPAILLFLLLGCPPSDPVDSAVDSGEPPGETDAQDTDSPVEPPEGWPEPWGVLSLGLGCLELVGTGFSSEAERAEAVAELVLEQGIAVLALQEVCRDLGGDDALALLHGALEDRSGVSWSSLEQVTTSDGSRELGLALLARGGLEEPFAMPYVQQGGAERWLLGAEIDTGTRVYTTQLEEGDEDVRGIQARAMAAAVVGSASSFELLLAGDFADENRSSAVWAQTGAGFVEDSAEQDDDRRHVLHHRSASWSALSSATLFDGSSGPAVSAHPGVAAWYEPGAGEDSCRTEIVVNVTVEPSQWVAVRGTDFPLDWSFGQPAWERAAGEWVWASSEIEDSTFEYKALLDDETWQVGEDIEGTGCDTNSTTPTWEEPDDGVDARDRR